VQDLQCRKSFYQFRIFLLYTLIMYYLIAKALLSGTIIMIVSEIAKRSPFAGALVASLPLISVLGMIWLWLDTKDVERIAAHSTSTFWMVIPSLPMFLVLPTLLHHGMHFYLALALSCTLTSALYLVMIWALRSFG
jgi:hypothetical protein